jgi:hypothetical protein
MTDLGLNLALSDPFMRIGQGIAKVGEVTQNAIDSGKQLIASKIPTRKSPAAKDINLPNRGRVDPRLPKRKVTR